MRGAESSALRTVYAWVPVFDSLLGQGRWFTKQTEWQMASKTNPITFFQQVRAETAKVTWPTRRETIISTIMVVVMAFLAATFFFLADQLMAYGVEFILGLGR